MSYELFYMLHSYIKVMEKQYDEVLNKADLWGVILVSVLWRKMVISAVVA